MEMLDSIFGKVASSRSAVLLKRDSRTGLFVQIIWNFQVQLSHRTLSVPASLLSLNLTLNVFKLDSLWKNKKCSSKIAPFKITENFAEKNHSQFLQRLFLNFLVNIQSFQDKVYFKFSEIWSPKIDCREINFQGPSRNWNYFSMV